MARDTAPTTVRGLIDRILTATLAQPFRGMLDRAVLAWPRPDPIDEVFADLDRQFNEWRRLDG